MVACQPPWADSVVGPIEAALPMNGPTQMKWLSSARMSGIHPVRVHPGVCIGSISCCGINKWGCAMNYDAMSEEVEVRAEDADFRLPGDLAVPERPIGVVLVAHGSGSSRFSRRNRAVAQRLYQGRLATLLFDLLTAEEHEIDQQTRQLRFDVSLLSDRLTAAVDWVHSESAVASLPIGLFGASTGAAAAMMTAWARPAAVRAIASRGGRTDLAADALPHVETPTLLIVGGEDLPVVGMNRAAQRMLAGPAELEIVPGASHLFEEPGALERAAELAATFFREHLARSLQPESATGAAS